MSTTCFRPRRCSSSSREFRLPINCVRGLAVHSGFGVFSDIIPTQIADLAATNAPNDPTFVGGIGGQVGGIGIAPGVAGSAVDAAANANQSFQTIFRSGGAPCAGFSLAHRPVRWPSA